MQSYSTIYLDNNPHIIKYNEMSNVHYKFWEKFYDNMPIEFDLTDTIKLNSDSKNVTLIINNTSETEFNIKHYVIGLEECQQAFRKYFIKLSHSNLQDLLQNSYC